MMLKRPTKPLICPEAPSAPNPLIEGNEHV